MQSSDSGAITCNHHFKNLMEAFNSTSRYLGDLSLVRPTGVKLLELVCSGIQLYVLLSPYLCFISFLYLVLYIHVLGDDASIS